MTQDQSLRLMHATEAMVVERSDSKDLPEPGIVFIDALGTEANAKVDLLNGGTITIKLEPGILNQFVVKKVYLTGTAATNIYVIPYRGRQ
jgi:hypothetical protein